MGKKSPEEKLKKFIEQQKPTTADEALAADPEFVAQLAQEAQRYIDYGKPVDVPWGPSPEDVPRKGRIEKDPRARAENEARRRLQEERSDRGRQQVQEREAELRAARQAHHDAQEARAQAMRDAAQRSADAMRQKVQEDADRMRESRERYDRNIDHRRR